MPVRHEQADGHATLEWVAAQPWFDGRLVMWGAQLPRHDAVGDRRGPTRLRQGAEPAGHRVEVPRRHRLPRRLLRARDGAVLGSTRSSTRSSGWRTVLRTPAAAAQGGRLRPADVLPLGKCDTRRLGETVPVYQDWLEHSAPGDPWWDARRLRAPAGPGAARQLRRRLVRPLPAGPGRRLRGAAPRRPLGPAHHRPLDALQPRPLRRDASATGPPGSTSSSGERHGREPRAPVRVFVMGSRTWQEFSLWPPAGETQQLVPRAAGARSAPSPPGESAPDRYHYNPHDPTPAVGGAGAQHGARRAARSSAGASTATTSSPTPARCSPRTSPSSAR